MLPIPLNAKLPDDGCLTAATRLERILELVLAVDESEAVDLTLWKPEMKAGFEACDCGNNEDAVREPVTKTLPGVLDEVEIASVLDSLLTNPEPKPLLAGDMMEASASPKD